MAGFDAGARLALRIGNLLLLAAVIRRAMLAWCLPSLASEGGFGAEHRSGAALSYPRKCTLQTPKSMASIIPEGPITLAARAVSLILPLICVSAYGTESHDPKLPSSRAQADV